MARLRNARERAGTTRSQKKKPLLDTHVHDQKRTKQCQEKTNREENALMTDKRKNGTPEKCQKQEIIRKLSCKAHK